MDQRCPRKLDKYPTRVCSMGRRKAEKMKSGRFNVLPCAKNECVWYVDDRKANYCFFKYMLDNGREHTLEEVAKLTATSINNIALREEEAKKNFRTQIVKIMKELGEFGDN